MPVTNKTPRLLAAAKEFNIGKETLVEFLASKGFDLGDVKPTTKLDETMYEALQQEFQQDKANKRKSDQIDLPRGVMVEAQPRKETETEAAPAENAPAPAVAEAPEAPEAPAPPEAPAAPEVPDIAPPSPEAETPVPPEAAEAEKPKVGGPKVITTIDLDAINSATRPRKGAAQKKKKEEEAPAAAEAAETPQAAAPEPGPADVPAPEATEAAPAEAPETPQAAPPQEAPAAGQPETPAESAPTVENIKVGRLGGPKVVGKIELPTPSERTRGEQRNKEKRKRKRIPIEKKPEAAKGQHPDHKDQNQRGPGRRGDQRKGRQAPDKEIDEKEIQEKIRETQAKLAGTSRGKGTKAKYRRARREEMAEQQAARDAAENNVLQVTEFISVSEFANLMDVSFADVISKCMSLGIMVSINQRLDAEVIELVASEFGYEVEFIGLEAQEDQEEEEEEDDPENLSPRAPIVTIMGHVDHGKTSLLDYIRSASVVAGEVGGITQHIGAYEVTLPGNKNICFLDTPGHEAFTAMRARGAKVADIAVIVIAADDAVMPQTREAISHAQAANMPMIFAINKIDKEGANPEKIKEQLAGMNLLVEDWGGKFQSQEISAKQGLHVDQLLEKILLEAELLELRANPDRPASGGVIEASLDKGRGYVATLLVQNGTLRVGDEMVSGAYYGRVKAMTNERGQKMSKAGPATPVQVLGLNGAPQAGEKFKIYEDESEAKETAGRRAQILREQGIRARKHITLDEIGRRLALGNFQELNVIIKGDVDGSVEALSDSLQKLSTEEIVVNIVHKGVGQITESDVLLATASDAIIVGFQVRPSLQAGRLAEKENIEIRTYSIIYDAIEEIKSAMEGMLEPKVEKKIVCNVEVREIFKISGVGTIAGCQVLDGKMNRNTRINLVRDGIVVYTGELASLKRYKDDVKEVSAGMECGLGIKNYNDIKIGDIVEGFEEVEVKRTL
ncbi:translation initiation factor IF-2 [Compostibacter hankyongensis]|uniref:Translation initiation factor IF-2 n=1 Tax=Compostibacter hankyongensis TaxID=1007089 RepID=A0ABP8G577_9BACT